MPDAVQAVPAGSDIASIPVAPSVPAPGPLPDPAVLQPDASGAPGQVGTALLTLASSADGGSQISVSLHPKELGAVRVRLELAPDGTARVLVAASEPGTLRSLMANQEHLHAALDAASVPAGGRHMSFELAPASAVGDAGPDHPASGASPGPDAQAGAGMAGFGGFGRQGQGGFAGGSGPGGSGGAIGSGDDDAGPLSPAVTALTARLLPAGSINITA